MLSLTLTCCFACEGAALEEVIADKAGKKDLKTGAAAGGLTGGFYAGIVSAYSTVWLCDARSCIKWTGADNAAAAAAAGGRVRGLQGLAAGAALGAASVFGREHFQRWRLTKALERYEEKFGSAPAVYYPNTDILVETKGPVRELEMPSLLPKSIKVSEEEIERRIQARVAELRQQELDGESSTSSSESV